MNSNVVLPEVIPYERYAAYHRLYGIAPRPNRNEVAIATNISGQINVWLVDFGGKMRRLTPFTEWRAFPVAWDATGNKLFIEADYQGNELSQILLFSFEKNWYEFLTNKFDHVHNITSETLSPDQKRIVFTGNLEDKTRLDIYELDFGNLEIKKLADGPGGAYVGAMWHKTGKIIVENAIDPDTSEILLVDQKNMKLERLTPVAEETIFWYHQQYENGFFFTSNYKREFLALYYYDLEKMNYKLVKELNWDISVCAVGSDYLLYSVNEDGISKLYLRELATEKEKLIDIPEGVVYGIKSFGETDKFVFTFTSYKNPADAYVLDLEAGEKPIKITEMAYGSVPEEYFTRPKIIRYKTFDERNISALLYKPKRKGKYPVIIVLHGGPEGQSRPVYSAFKQYMAHRGFAIVEPNFRGSSGYGRSFQRLIRKDWGGSELKDVEYLVKYLMKQDWVDAERICVMGASFGGFLTLSCVTRLPDYWRCGIDIFGPSNLITLIETAPPFWKDMVKKLIGDPEDEKERKMLEERSPINHIDRIKAPLLIIQGAKDFRVKKSESDQIVEALRKRGIEVEYIVFEDEGHGFTKEKNIRIAEKAVINFIIKHVSS